MIIPNYIDAPFVEEKEGKFYLTDAWKQVLLELFQTLQTNLSQEGFHLPPQPTANLNLIAANPNNTSIPILIWDSTVNQLKINVNGVFHVIPYT